MPRSTGARNKSEVSEERATARRRALFALAASGVIVSLFVLRGFEEARPGGSQTSLVAKPSEALSEALFGKVRPDAPPFEASLVDTIRRRGALTVTLHVALFADTGNGRAGAFGDGDNPATNLYWGALYGVETHFANAAGWQRRYTDDGGGPPLLRRVVFSRRVEPTPAWRERGVDKPFDLFVLANAWPNARIIEAMEQPLRDAICGAPVRIEIDGRMLEFAGGSAVVGYVGQNHMLDEYWDPFAQLGGCAPSRQVGVFYLCPRSAVVLHEPVVRRGLYAVLFTRSAATPEAYLVDGMFRGLASGELGDAFIAGAAAEYARYQKTVSVARAASMLIR
ncbi:MAG: hypothetical protein ACE5E1_10225 [Phycisphaerae bacterium]